MCVCERDTERVRVSRYRELEGERESERVKEIHRGVGVEIERVRE